MITNNVLKLTALSAFVCMMPSCAPDNYDGIIMGTAVATPASFHNGDQVKVGIGGNAHLEIVKISGRDYPPIIHYEIDGVEVAQSREWSAFFETSFTAQNLTPGEHTLSVSVPDIYANVDYTINIASSKVIVLE